VFVVVWLVKGRDLFEVLEVVAGFACVAVVLGFGVDVVVGGGDGDGGGVGICQNQWWRVLQWRSDLWEQELDDGDELVVYAVVQ